MNKFCRNCGKELENDIKFCPNCGTSINNDNSTGNYQNCNSYHGKSKIAAGILGIFLGSFGVHNFYLGYTSKAVIQLLLTSIGWILCGLGPLVAGIWGFVEGILILTGNINKDAYGNLLVN